MEVLPRVGYAKPDLGHPANWACPATVASSATIAEHYLGIAPAR